MSGKKRYFYYLKIIVIYAILFDSSNLNFKEFMIKTVDIVLIVVRR